MVSRRTPVNRSMRRKDHPSFPSAMTCCFVSSFMDVASRDQFLATCCDPTVAAMSRHSLLLPTPDMLVERPQGSPKTGHRESPGY
jgi:hypothetical protein